MCLVLYISVLVLRRSNEKEEYSTQNTVLTIIIFLPYILYHDLWIDCSNQKESFFSIVFLCQTGIVGEDVLLFVCEKKKTVTSQGKNVKSILINVQKDNKKVFYIWWNFEYFSILFIDYNQRKDGEFVQFYFYS